MTDPMGRRHARAVVPTLALAAFTLLVAPFPALAGTAVSPQVLTVATEVADISAPTAPSEFRVVTRTKSSAITLGWVASYDAVGVAGYRLYRNGLWSGTLYQAGVDLIGTVMYDRITGRDKGSITYQLYAFDAAGNISEPATLVITP